MRTAALPSQLIRSEASTYVAFRRQLLEELPDLDEETLVDTLEGLTDLREMLAELIRSALDDEALVAGLSTRLSDLKARMERLETRAKRMICSQEMPPIEVRVFRHIPLAGERTEDDEGIEVHGRAEGVHHPAG